MRGAPVVYLLHEVAGEQLGDQLPEPHPGGLIVSLRKEQLDQAVVDRLSVCFLILGRQGQAPRDAVAGNLRLVREEAVKVGSVLFIVRFVYFMQKIRDDLPVQGIHVEGVDIIVEAVVLKTADDAGTARILQIRGKGLDAQVLLLELLPLAVDFPAAEAGGPAILVVCPCVHTLLFCFIDAGADVLKPLLAHILGLQTAPGVHEEAADAGVRHQIHLPDRFGDAELFIP